MTIQIKPVAGRIGAQLDGIKLGGDISAQAFEFINEALLKYKVLSFAISISMTPGTKHFPDVSVIRYRTRLCVRPSKVLPSCTWMPRKHGPTPGTPM